MRTVSLFVIVSVILLGAVTPQFAFSDGGGPALCEGGPTTPDADVMHPTTTVDAGAGNKITGICIKDGAGSFGPGNQDQHSELITTSGIVGENNCYDVQFIEMMQKVTVEEKCGTSMQVSHIDYFMMPKNGGPPGGGPMAVGGDFIGIDTTAVLVAGAQNTAAWMIPVILAAAGIGIVIARKF